MRSFLPVTFENDYSRCYQCKRRSPLYYWENRRLRRLCGSCSVAKAKSRSSQEGPIRLRLDPIAEVEKEAKRQGLVVDKPPPQARAQGQPASLKKWLLLEGRRCQVSLTVRHEGRGYAGYFYVRLYRPSSVWPDYIVYCVKNRSPGTPRFYVVPRNRVRKHTWMRESYMRQRYGDDKGWALLRRPIRRKIGRPFEDLPPEIVAAWKMAERHGLRVTLIPGKHASRGFLRRRLHIANCRCQVFKASRLTRKPATPKSMVIGLHAPKKKWGQFVIYVAWPLGRKGKPVFFILPAEKAPKKDTTATLGARSWIACYRKAWHLFQMTSR